MTSSSEQHHVAVLERAEGRFNVSVMIEFNGVDHVGYLWFAEDGWDDDGFRDFSPILGTGPDAIQARARAIPEGDLHLRLERARTERRRASAFRRATDDVLHHIRYLHRIATSMREGLLGEAEATAELDETERRLHEMVGRLRTHAGATS